MAQLQPEKTPRPSVINSAVNGFKKGVDRVKQQVPAREPTPAVPVTPEPTPAAPSVRPPEDLGKGIYDILRQADALNAPIIRLGAGEYNDREFAASRKSPALRALDSWAKNQRGPLGIEVTSLGETKSVTSGGIKEMWLTLEQAAEFKEANDRYTKLAALGESLNKLLDDRERVVEMAGKPELKAALDRCTRLAYGVSLTDYLNANKLDPKNGSLAIQMDTAISTMQTEGAKFADYLYADKVRGAGGKKEDIPVEYVAQAAFILSKFGESPAVKELGEALQDPSKTETGRRLAVQEFAQKYHDMLLDVRAGANIDPDGSKSSQLSAEQKREVFMKALNAARQEMGTGKENPRVKEIHDVANASLAKVKAEATDALAKVGVDTKDMPKYFWQNWSKPVKVAAVAALVVGAVGTTILLGGLPQAVLPILGGSGIVDAALTAKGIFTAAVGLFGGGLAGAGVGNLLHTITGGRSRESANTLDSKKSKIEADRDAELKKIEADRDAKIAALAAKGMGSSRDAGDLARQAAAESAAKLAKENEEKNQAKMLESLMAMLAKQQAEAKPAEAKSAEDISAEDIKRQIAELQEKLKRYEPNGE